MATYRVDRRLYFTGDGKIVDISKREKAVQLFKPKGGQVSQAELDKYGDQIKSYIPELQKKKEPTKNKMQTPTKNKAAEPEAEKPKKPPEDE